MGNPDSVLSPATLSEDRGLGSAVWNADIFLNSGIAAMLFFQCPSAKLRLHVLFSVGSSSCLGCFHIRVFHEKDIHIVRDELDDLDEFLQNDEA